MATHDFGAWSLVPPVLAILLAIVTRRVLLSLLAGIVLGAWMLDPQPAAFLVRLAEGLLWSNLQEEGHLRVFCFTLLMGAMVGVIQRSGGMQALVARLAGWAQGRCGGQLLTWFLGLLVFVDDYASCLLIGNTMRPLADRLRISREKLAYLVDSTAAPVAGLALVSTWVAAEISAIEEGLAKLSLTEQVDGMDLFLRSIPYRFYVLWTIWMVALSAWWGRDFGPMLAAERRACRNTPNTDSSDHDHQPPADKRRAWIAIGPVLLTVLVTLGLLIITGRHELIQQNGQAPPLMTLEAWAKTFGNGNSNLSLTYGALIGLLSAVGWCLWQKALAGDEIRDAAFLGARHVIGALAILWFAWTLSDLTDAHHLGSGVYLARWLSQSMDVRWMPALVFVLSCLVAFSTGTSWGTMSLLMPLVVPTVFRMLEDSVALSRPDLLHHPIFLASIGGVLSGAIFGDHCSPISDTTVLSSQASGCPHVAHVVTQIPYACSVAFWAVFLGAFPVGIGISVGWLLVLGCLAIAVQLWLVGRKPEP
ncbi:MAG: membrane protein [Pirellulaceae bacterium]|nr:MAG: membrane protein [Pirellulaceae bacterium]